MKTHLQNKIDRLDQQDSVDFVQGLVHLTERIQTQAMLHELRIRIVMVLCVLSGGVWAWGTLMRALVRKRDGIPGTPLRDFGVAACCFFCGVCQLARHEGLVKGKYNAVSPTGEKAHQVARVAAEREMGV